MNKLSSLITPAATSFVRPTGPQGILIKGAILGATVISRHDSGSFTLDISGQKVQAQSTLVLEPGQTLWLKVTDVKPVPQLQVIQPKTSQEIEKAMRRRALPRQDSLGPLFVTLQSLARTSPILPPNLARIAEAMLRNLPLREDLTDPEHLKRTVARSPTLFEAAFANKLQEPFVDSVVGQNLKLWLFRLRNVAQDLQQKAMRPSSDDGTLYQSDQARLPDRQRRPHVRTKGGLESTELAHQTDSINKLLAETEAALARVRLCQLECISETNRSEVYWLFEIPFRDSNNVRVLRLHVGGERSRNDQTERQWRAELVLDFDNLGSIIARLRLQGEGLVVSIWAEHSVTADLLRKHAFLLESALRNCGLEDPEIHCYVGKPPAARGKKETEIGDLVDEIA